LLAEALKALAVPSEIKIEVAQLIMKILNIV